MRITKLSVCWITALVVSLGLTVASPSANAGPLVAGTGAISEALKEIKVLLGQAALLSRGLAALNLAMRNEIDGVFDLIEEARNLLLACDGEFDCEDPAVIHNAALLLEQAQRTKMMILVIDIEEFLDFLHEFEVGLGELEGKIGGLKEIGKIKVSDATYMEIKLNSCNKIITLIDSQVFEVAALLEDGDDGEDPNDPDDADDVNDYLAIALQGLRLEEGLEMAEEALAHAQSVLEQAIAAKDDIHVRKVPGCQSVLKAVQKRLEKILRQQRYKTPRLSHELASSGFSIAGAASVSAQVYALGGALVGDVQRAGSMLRLEESRLANGTYLVVVTGLSPEGRVIASRVQKFVVLR